MWLTRLIPGIKVIYAKQTFYHTSRNGQLIKSQLGQKCQQEPFGHFVRRMGNHDDFVILHCKVALQNGDRLCSLLATKNEPPSHHSSDETCAECFTTFCSMTCFRCTTLYNKKGPILELGVSLVFFTTILSFDWLFVVWPFLLASYFKVVSRSRQSNLEQYTLFQQNFNGTLNKGRARARDTQQLWH